MQTSAEHACNLHSCVLLSIRKLLAILQKTLIFAIATVQMSRFSSLDLHSHLNADLMRTCIIFNYLISSTRNALLTIHETQKL